METRTKVIIAISVLFGLVVFLGIKCLILSSRFETANSALENTTDATIIDIEEHKTEKRQIEAKCANEIKGVDLKITNKCKKIIKNMPQRFIDDGTCEVQNT